MLGEARWKSEAPEVLDAVVASVLEASGVRGPVSVFGLARACGLRFLERAGRAEGLRGSRICYDPRASDEWHEALVARCVAQWSLRWCSVPESGSSISYVARAFIKQSRG